jgi:NDP-sugar pyrophosphorylase family protein
MILNGGIGTRLYPKYKDIPKCLIDISGKPFIIHQLELFKKNGFKDIIICVGEPFGDRIIDFVNKNSLGLNIKFSFLGNPNSVGTGGRLKEGIKLLENNDSFFSIYGDSYLPINYKSVQKKYIEECKMGLMTIYKNDNNFDKSNVVYKSNKILAYDKNKTKDMTYIDYGLSIFNKKIFNIECNLDVDLSFFHKKLILENELSSFVVKERFYEIGSFNGIKDLNYFFKNNII